MSAFITPVIAAYVLVVTLIFGLVMGSFLNCLAWRATHSESVLKGRSHCATCGHVLAWRDLIPVVSWLLSGGRCRYCGEHISCRYPVTEIICAAAYVAVVARFGMTLETVEILIFCSILLVVSLTDIDDMRIPNSCIVTASIVRVLYLVVAAALGPQTPWVSLGSTAGAGSMASTVLYYVASAAGVGVALVVLALIMDRVLGRASMGWGDAKLLAVAALYVGWQQSLLAILLACIFGIITGLWQQRKAGSDAFAWGPSIALATFITLLAGDALIGFYLGLFTI
ncbi:MAG: prepilin peptidase [Atopobiaceae bacterium]|jgi:leader peptidase (prepilin peptidase)/N-methyltransferase